MPRIITRPAKAPECNPPPFWRSDQFIMECVCGIEMNFGSPISAPAMCCEEICLRSGDLRNLIEVADLGPDNLQQRVQSALVLGDGFERLASFLFEVGFNRSRQRNAIRILEGFNGGRLRDCSMIRSINGGRSRYLQLCGGGRSTS